MADSVTFQGKPGSKGFGRLAGSAFGLNLADLFKDDNEETSVNFNGFVAPTKQTKTFYKGQSPRTMTYKAAAQPTREVTETTGSESNFSLSGTNKKAGAEAAAPIPEPTKPSLKDDYLANFSKYDQGAQNYFGGQDVDYLRSQGMSDSDIRDIAEQRSTVQELPAAVYQRLGGVTAAEMSTPSSPAPQTAAKNYLSGAVDVGAQGVFGGQDVRALLSQGASQDEVRATARAIRAAGQTLPNAVYRELGQF
jgi:hypothetical protein